MQDRAVRTRRAILVAAAKVFEERGYQAATIAEILQAGNVTKGALYFHFATKEDLVDGVLSAQDAQPALPARDCKLQELVDMTMVQAYRLRTDCMVRAGARLSLDQRLGDAKRTGPFKRWIRVCEEMLEAARRQGELLPHVVPADSAVLLVGAFAGVQATSQTLSGYEDLMPRVSVLLRHVLPSVAQPSVLTSIDLSEERGERVYKEALASWDQPDGFPVEAISDSCDPRVVAEPK
ncbi:MAG: TetR family transcriptional regulator [Catenulispora sp. 13_1_20CM_3_70_7]|jgi:AcrR family transcriptional regulator|nr:MAG: TetR family transcriptional regulator [Catenulispora sp. 13_1_20CM_3_70_7]